MVPQKLQEIGHRGWTGNAAVRQPLWLKRGDHGLMGVGIGVLAQPQLAVRFMTVKSSKEIFRALGPGGLFILTIPGVAYIVGALSNLYFWKNEHKLAIQMVVGPDGKPNIDKIIPTFIQHAMPEWFGYLFMLVLLAAAMSTLSGQFHAIGTSIGRDLFQQGIGGGRRQERTMAIARAGVVAGFVLTLVLGYGLSGSIIAIATALFFGMCAAVFLPAYTAALFWRRASRAGVTAGMVVGLLVWGFWVLFVQEKQSAALGICQFLSGKPSLLAGTKWAVVDSFVIALPVSALVTWLASLATKPMPAEHIERCFGSAPIA